MPAAVVAVGAAVVGGAASAAVGAVVGGGVAGAVLGSIAGAAVSIGVSYAGRAIAGGPQRPDEPRPTFEIPEQEKPEDTLQGLRGRTLMVVQPITNHKVVYGRVRVGGPLVFVHTAPSSGSSTKDLLHLVVVHAGREVEAIETVYFNDEALPLDGSGNVTGGSFKDHARLFKHLGSAGQGADGNLISETGGRWTDAHRLRGRAYTHARLRYDEDAYASGIPNVSAVIQGRKVHDPRTGTTVWSANAALCVLDYLTAPWGLGADLATEIDTDSFIAAANICDESVDTLDGTEPRYQCNGVVDVGNRPVQSLEELLTSCAGRLTFVGGKWRLHPGAWQPALLTFNEIQARAPVTLRPRRSRRELVNTVRGAFTSPDHAWQATDYPPVSNAGYVSADGGEVAMTLDLPFTTSHTMAQRIARIALEQNRREMRLDFPANLAGLRVTAGNTIAVSLERFGLIEKPFTVVSWQLTEDMGVDLSLTQDAPEVYQHAAGLLTPMS